MRSRRHFGRLWGALGELWGHQGRSKEPKADFEVNLVKTYVFYHQKRRDRPFRRRVAKVGVTKYRILHGSSADGQPERRRCTQSSAVTHAARNPTVEHCLGKNSALARINLLILGYPNLSPLSATKFPHGGLVECLSSHTHFFFVS